MEKVYTYEECILWAPELQNTFHIGRAEQHRNTYLHPHTLTHMCIKYQGICVFMRRAHTHTQHSHSSLNLQLPLIIFILSQQTRIVQNNFDHSSTSGNRAFAIVVEFFADAIDDTVWPPSIPEVRIASGNMSSCVGGLTKSKYISKGSTLEDRKPTVSPSAAYIICYFSLWILSKS